MKDSARDEVLLREVLDLIELTMSNVPANKEAFLADVNARDATALRIQAIGEHMRSLSEEFRNDHPELPWRQAIAMRNIVAHEYGNLDYDIVWQVVVGGDFDAFHKQVKSNICILFGFSHPDIVEISCRLLLVFFHGIWCSLLGPPLSKALKLENIRLSHWVCYVAHCSVVNFQYLKHTLWLP